ncbi:cytochrome c1 [Rhodosalinus sediminis]|uniref:Cytochrome c1 n=1 Tax=Rhodosalinus sediminis TaxID=1940533 RepID=A0A3D9BXY4_9RHOB|nr:cytochrome c1 [Rhodosalinus sediminis]REC58262.1 cytochrome c1 [Rhodosalinus sediminis]
MFRTFAIAAATALSVAGSGAFAAGGAGEVTDYDFSFEGPFGTYDQAQLQRGLQVYTQVCASCHGLEHVPIRTLSSETGPGMPMDQVRAYAADLMVIDPAANPDIVDPDTGDVQELKPVNHFPANESQGAPDLSLMAKARAGFSGPYGTGLNQLFKGMGGAEYIASLLMGYTGEDKLEAGALLYENKVMDGGWINMAPPLYEGAVEYQDGTPATEEQMAKDVAAFLMWTAEPKMMERKQAGFTGVLFLTVLTVLLYLTNKRIWAPIKARAKSDES